MEEAYTVFLHSILKKDGYGDNRMTRKEKFIDNLEYLKQHTVSVLKKCTFIVETNFNGKQNIEPVMVPCGDLKYPSIWVRDTAMNSECGLIDELTMRRHLALIASHGQNGDKELLLENKSDSSQVDDCRSYKLQWAPCLFSRHI